MNRQIADEAAEWFVELNEEEPGAEVRQRFHAWLCRSPDHVSAYLKILPIWEEGAQLDTHPNDPEALIAWARATTNIVPLSPLSAPRGEGQGEGTSISFRYYSLAATIALIAIVASWLFINRNTYATDIGEQRLITLADGSNIELNSRSKMKVRFSDQERSIELLEGQALFKVAKDSARPFVVRSGDTSVLVVGTQFDVYRKKSGTIVTVVEGRVAVSSLSSPLAPAGEGRVRVPSQIPLVAGEQVIIDPSTSPQPKPADVALATAWTQQQLVFFRAPLAEVVEEFNRYNKRQLIVRDEPLLKTRRISGTFSSTDPASLIRFLRDQPGLRVEERDVGVVIGGAK